MNFTLTDGTRVHLIGDPHLGRKFEVGVPLHRRGEREASQLAHFKRELDADADMVIMVGDLFDHPYVGYAVAQDAAQAVSKAVINRPDVTFVMMAGNHDMPRNVEAVGVFDDFIDRLVGRFDNLYILTAPQIIRNVACFPWEWDKRADDQVRDFSDSQLAGIEAAVGHWDLSLFEGKDNHLAPVEALPAGISLWSGHYHVAGDYKVNGRVVRCTGSLEPYTHGEDPSGDLYVTVTREEALTRDDLHGKNVRVVIKRGEELPDLDALSVVAMLDNSVDEGATAQQVSLDTFDWNGILKSKLDPLDQRVKDFIYERLPENAPQE